MELLFTDGRLFTRVDLRFGSSHAEHWCGEDLQMIGTKSCLSHGFKSGGACTGRIGNLRQQRTSSDR